VKAAGPGPPAAGPPRAGWGLLRDLPTDWDALLRARGDFAVASARLPWVRLVGAVTLAGGGFGLAMGSFAGGMAALYSALKLPLLVSGALLVCLPSFYVINAVLGLADDYLAACRGILAAQATLAVTLLSLAPLALTAQLLTADYHTIKLIDGALFALASSCAQGTLARHYGPLLRRNPRHRLALLLWPALYVFVSLQLAYALRPFVGNPDFPTEFVRADWVGNVYLDLYWAARGAVGR